MLLLRPLHIAIDYVSNEHIKGLDAFLTSFAPGVARIEDEGGMHDLVSYLTSDVSIDAKDGDALTALVEKAISDLDAMAEQHACNISAAFQLPFQIYGLLTQPFYGFMTRDEFEITPRYIEKERPFHPEIHRSVDVDIAGSILRERPEAARLLAGAVNATRPTARLLSYVRLFEAAFKKSGVDLKRPLFEFLQDAGLSYSRSETDRWIHYRHRVVHADRGGRAMYDSDVYSILPRISQAGLDVVFNKKDWSSKSTRRTEPTKLGTTFVGRNMNFTKGRFSVVRPITTDFFGRFPVDPRGRVGLEIGSLLPKIEKQIGKIFHGAITQNGYASRTEIVANEK